MGDLRSLAGSLGLAGRVHFAGYQARPERFLQVMDVFALPSRLEGMPLAVLEAWAAGLPVVATRVGGLPKMIEDGSNGLLIEHWDTLQDEVAREESKSGAPMFGDSFPEDR